MLAHMHGNMAQGHFPTHGTVREVAVHVSEHALSKGDRGVVVVGMSIIPHTLADREDYGAWCLGVGGRCVTYCTDPCRSASTVTTLFESASCEAMAVPSQHCIHFSFRFGYACTRTQA
jgi:hypothetical protein